MNDTLPYNCAMQDIGVLVGPGRRAFDIAVVQEVYEDRAERGLPPTRIRILAEQPEVALDAVHTMRRTDSLSAFRELDLLVAPGSHDVAARPSRAEIETVKAAVDAGIPVVSLCTGAFVLADAGVLDGREATTHWRFADDLARRFPRVRVRPRDLYCGGDGVWTSAGVTAGIDLLLHLVRQDWGASAAETIARAMVTPVYRPGSQAQYADTATLADTSASVGRLQQTVAADLRHPWTVDELARQCALSRRTFQRWFTTQAGTTPVKWLNDIRVREAQRLLEQTDLPVAHVAQVVGFATDDVLRKHFVARLATTPTGHRASFRAGRDRKGVPDPRRGRDLR